MTLIEGVIVGRRSMGRKLAFADIGLNSCAPTSSTLNHDPSATDKPSNGSADELGSIKVIFFRKTFLDPLDLELASNEAYLDEQFPTKMTSLPYGASVVMKLGNCQKVPSKDGSGKIEDVWEVSRWKMRGNPRELAEQLASLEGSALSKEVSSISLKEEYQEESLGVIIGGGALSCSTYLRARRETFVSAKLHTMRLSESTKEKDADLTDTNIGENNVSATVAKEADKNRPTAIIATKADDHPTTASNSVSTSEKFLYSDFCHGGKQAKARRAKIFASWILETFFGLPMGTASGGLDQMICQPCCSTVNDETNANKNFLQNAHVLDIAGGKGQLSLELYGQQLSHPNFLSLPGVDKEKHSEKELGVSPPISQCTIIDPLVRKGDSKQWNSKLKRARSHVNWLRGQSQNKKTEHFGDSRDDTFKNSCNANVSLNTNKDEASKAQKKKPSGDDTSSAIKHLAMCFNAASFPKLYSRCTSQPDDALLLPSTEHSTSFPLPAYQNELRTLLLLGLHPDQCTEDIVDMALKYNLPFAIVPCCVFPDLFPSRKLATKTMQSEITNDTKTSIQNHNIDVNTGYPNGIQNGGNLNTNLLPVRTYDDFLQYLMDKDSGLKMTRLPFEGKNVVIYKTVS